MLSRIPTPVQQALAVVLPLLSLICAYVLIVPRYLALRRDQEKLVRTSQVVSAKRALISQAEQRGPIPPVIARVPGDPGEAPAFLRDLNSVARACGVNIASISASEAPAVPAPAAAPAAGATSVPAAGATTAGLPPDTTPREIQISVSGPFRAMAQFFASLENYQRLISVSNVTMSASGPNSAAAAAAGTDRDTLTAQFRLTRYVGPASPAAAAAPIAPVAAAAPPAP